MKWFSNLARKADPPIDYIGQYLASRIIHTTLLLTVLVSLVTGHIYKDILVVAYVYFLGSFLVLALVVPAWPIFRRNPVPSLLETKKNQ